MLPSRRTALALTLNDLAPAARGDHEVRLQVELQDLTVLDGVLVSAVQTRVIPADEIRGIHVARRRTGREFLLLGGLILAVTPVVVAAASLPLLRPHLPTIAGTLVILGGVGLTQLRRHPRFGAWLTDWQRLFDADRP